MGGRMHTESHILARTHTHARRENSPPRGALYITSTARWPSLIRVGVQFLVRGFRDGGLEGLEVVRQRGVGTYVKACNELDQALCRPASSGGAAGRRRHRLDRSAEDLLQEFPVGDREQGITVLGVVGQKVEQGLAADSHNASVRPGAPRRPALA